MVRRFIDEGACVLAGDIDIDGARALVQQLGDRAIARKMDVADQEEFAAAINAALGEWGKLDILVNNAAVSFPVAPLQTTTDGEFDRLINVNLRGVWLGCKLAYPHLKETRGCVLNISSMAGITGQQDHAVYAATKGAVNALTKSTAVDWGADRIRINALSPAGVWTDALHRWCDEHPDAEQIRGYLDRLHSLGYCPQPDEIATVAAFLCSDDAKFMTGAIVPVSGGSECGYRL